MTEQPSQSAINEWLDDISSRPQTLRDLVLERVRSDTVKAFEAQDITMLPIAADMGKAFGVQGGNFTVILHQLMADGLVRKIQGKGVKQHWAAI